MSEFGNLYFIMINYLYHFDHSFPVLLVSPQSDTLGESYDQNTETCAMSSQSVF
jgi:hypothetical protein